MVFYVPRSLAKRPYRLARSRTHGFHPCNRGSNPRGDAILKPAFRGGFFGAWARKCWFGALAGGKTTQKAATIPSKRATAGDDAFPAGKFVLVEVEVKLDVAQHLHLLNDRHAGTVFAAKNFVDFGAVTDDFRS